MTRKIANEVNQIEHSTLALYNLGLDYRILRNFVDRNSLAYDNLWKHINSARDAISKSSLPKGMMRYTNPGSYDYQGAVKIGNYYPIGTQPINPFEYSFKPFGNKVLDFDPNTGEFILYSIQEWRNKTQWTSGNSKNELLDFIPMGMELELVYRNKAKQCDNCYEYDNDHDETMFSFCEDDYCHSGDSNFDYHQVNKNLFKFLATLNASFGAIGTKANAVWIAKHDSSVDIEFVSMPMTIRAWRAGLIVAETIFKSFKVISKDCKAFYGPCGGHIHLDKDSFTNTYQYYAFLSMHYDNPAFVAGIAQRSVGQDNQWAYLYKPNDFARVVKYKLRSQSRQAVNVTDHTVELRYFRSNLKIGRLLKNVEFVQSMYEFTRGMSYQDLAKFKSNTLKYYLLYIRATRHKYNNLFNFLVSRKWIKNEYLIDNGITKNNSIMFEDSNNISEQEVDIRNSQAEYNADTDNINSPAGRLLNALFNDDDPRYADTDENDRRFF